MDIPPPVRRPQYNQGLDGVYGVFGAGAGVQAFYLQSALEPGHLHQVSMISDIRGSEQWPVRDLFQRDVDDSRITDSLLPYLQDANKIKFFNPLTLTVLPMDDGGSTVLTKMPRVIESRMEDRGRNWNVLEREGFFRIRWVEDAPQYAELAWNDRRARLVAIDGQHRLSALKRCAKDAQQSLHAEFMQWRIPVVIVTFRAHQAGEPPTVLEVVRSIFVYINTEAKQVNEARKILLSDESVNDVCTQELLQRSHENDLLPLSDRDSGVVPLLFYDWRGEEQEKRDVHAPAAIKSVEEVRNWFSEYILGRDFSAEQETALGIDPTQKLHGAFHDKKLSHSASQELRTRAREEVVPAVAYVLENFVPYASYIGDLRALEREYDQESQSDLARHAFYELRFGTNHADESLTPHVTSIVREIRSRIEDSKRQWLRKPLELDIGMRGVMSAFGRLRVFVGDRSWMDYARWFTNALNRVNERGQLDLSKKPAREDLLHIVQDHNEVIVNYRLDYADSALGAYTAMFVAAYGRVEAVRWSVDWSALRDECLDSLGVTLRRGYRKEVRPRLREHHPSGGKELTDAVSAEADKLSERHLRRLERKLERIDRATSDSNLEEG